MRYMFYLCVVIGLFYSLAFPYELSYSVSAALKLCASAVIPSLFMFLALSKIISYIIKNKSLNNNREKLPARLFNLSPSLLPICLCGLFCGAPSGTVAVCELYSAGLCSKEEAEKALTLCNNCSAAFIIGFVSASLQSISCAVIVLCSNILATLTVYLLFFRGKRITNHHIKMSKTKEYSISHMLTDSISSATNTVLTLSGYVIFFYCISSIISEKLYLFLIKLSVKTETAILFKSILCNLFEITTGVLSSSSIQGNIRTLIVAGGTAFCGLSIIFQIISIAGKYNLSCKSFILSKLICSFVSPLISLAILFIVPWEISAMNLYTSEFTLSFTSNDFLILTLLSCMVVIGAVLWYHVDKKHKNRL